METPCSLFFLKVWEVWKVWKVAGERVARPYRQVTWFGGAVVNHGDVMAGRVVWRLGPAPPRKRFADNGGTRQDKRCGPQSGDDGGRAGRATLPTGDVTTRRCDVVVGRRDPRRRVSVSPTTAERAKVNAVDRNRVTTAVARVARPYHPTRHLMEEKGIGAR